MTAVEAHEYFDYQRTARADLPNPQPFVENLSLLVVEILLGLREVEQIARWVDEDTYMKLVQRASIARRSRALRGRIIPHTAITLGAVSICEPADGIVEAAVVVHGGSHARAVVVRAEGLDRRWRATMIAAL